MERQELHGLRRQDARATKRRRGTSRGTDKSRAPWLVASTAAALATAWLSVVALNSRSHPSTTFTTTSIATVVSDRPHGLGGYHEGNIEKTLGHRRLDERRPEQGQGWWRRRRRQLVEQYESGRESPCPKEILEDDHGQDDTPSALVASVLNVSEPFGVSHDERELAFSSRSLRSQKAESPGRHQPRSSRELKSFHKQPGIDLINIRDAKGVAEGEGKAGSSPGGADKRCFVDPHGVHRCSANIYFIGVSKCATSSFAAWMASHPALLWISKTHTQDRIAEAHVLDSTPEEYRLEITKGRYAKWRVAAPKAQTQHHVLDYTPHYISMAEVPYRIAEIYGTGSYDGSVKYLAILREPVARAVSSWEFKFDLHSVNPSYPRESTSLHEHRDFATAVAEGLKRSNNLIKCRERTREEYERQGETATSRKGALRFLLELNLINCNPRQFLEPGLYLAHVGKGLYAMALERWFGVFGRENVKVIFLSDMVADPVGTLEDVFTFLGMNFIDVEGKNGLSREAWKKVVSANHNRTNQTKKAILDEQVTPELLETMRKFYAPHNTALEQLLGVPLPAGWTTLADYA